MTVDLHSRTAPISPAKGSVLEYRGFSLKVVKGPDVGKSAAFVQRSVEIGSADGTDFQISDRTVSRHHAIIDITEEGYRIRDEQSRNGTRIAGCRIGWAILKPGVVVETGSTQIRFELGDAQCQIELSDQAGFGRMLGKSTAMRELYATLEKVGNSDVTVLLEGESGCGKELAAAALHDASPRAGKPFEVFDCASVPENLAESELLGHERGAFTGAAGKRIGVFERANGGTVFLDEIGELPDHLQPKLLRVLDAREFRPVGASHTVKIDVRVVAATNRDLAAMVKENRFRLDLYHRLVVVKLKIPPLRHRTEDIPLLIDSFFEQARAQGRAVPQLSQEAIARLTAYPWPGNVRELRNFVERGVLLEEDFAALPFETAIDQQNYEAGSSRPSPPTMPPPGMFPGSKLPSLHFAPPPPLPPDGPLPPYHEAKTRLVDDWEREYCLRVLGSHEGNISAAARAAGLDRKSFKYLLNKHSLKPAKDGD